RSEIIRFAVPATLSSITGSLAIWACNSLLIKQGGYIELAVFAAANSLRSMVLFVPSVSARVVSPILDRLLAGGDVPSYRRTFWGAVVLNTGMAFLFAVVLSFCGTYVLQLFGKDFIAPPSLIPLLLGSVVIEVLACNLYQAIFTSRSLWW